VYCPLEEAVYVLLLEPTTEPLNFHSYVAPDADGTDNSTDWPEQMLVDPLAEIVAVGNGLIVTVAEPD
jgi:hypothetical protein